jgi:hypothetical protein
LILGLARSIKIRSKPEEKADTKSEVEDKMRRDRARGVSWVSEETITSLHLAASQVMKATKTTDPRTEPISQSLMLEKMRSSLWGHICLQASASFRKKVSFNHLLILAI